MTKSQNKRLRNRHLLSWNRKERPAQSGYRASWIFWALDQGTWRDYLRVFSPGRLRVTSLVITRRLHLALFAALIGLGCAPALAVTQASISGLVCDSAGVPQMGAVVEL